MILIGNLKYNKSAIYLRTIATCPFQSPSFSSSLCLKKLEGIGYEIGYAPNNWTDGGERHKTAGLADCRRYFPGGPSIFRGPKNCILFIYFYFLGSTEKAKLKLTGLSRITVGLVRTLSRVQAWRKTNQFNYPLNCLLKFSWMCNMGPRLVLPQNRKRRRQCRKKTLLNLLLEMAVYLFIYLFSYAIFILQAPYK